MDLFLLYKSNSVYLQQLRFIYLLKSDTLCLHPFVDTLKVVQQLQKHRHWRLLETLNKVKVNVLKTSDQSE